MASDPRSALNMDYETQFDYPHLRAQSATNGAITLMPDVELRKWAFESVLKHGNSHTYSLPELVDQAETLANFVLNGKSSNK